MMDYIEKKWSSIKEETILNHEKNNEFEWNEFSDNKKILKKLFSIEKIAETALNGFYFFFFWKSGLFSHVIRLAFNGR